MIFSTTSCPSLPPFPLSLLPSPMLVYSLSRCLLRTWRALHPTVPTDAQHIFFSIKKTPQQLHGHLCVSSSLSPVLLHLLRARTPQTGGSLQEGRSCSFPISRGHCSPKTGHGAGTERGAGHPRAVPAPWARGRDLAPHTALPEPAAPLGKLLVPGLAPASPKIQLNGTGFSTNLSGRIQPCGAAGRPWATIGDCWKLSDIPWVPQILAQPWSPTCVQAHHPSIATAVGMPSWVSKPPRVSKPEPVFFLEEFSRMRAIKTMGKWKVFVRELRWQRRKVLW